MIKSKIWIKKRIRINKLEYGAISIVFDMFKWKRLLDSFAQPISILDMTTKITNSGVKDIIKRVLP
jgi:hypothetical protein